MKFCISILLLLISFCGFSQNSAVTDFKETHGTALALYFYPSTLRMINIERNKEFDDMIRDIRKARFFRMDSGAVSSQELAEFTSELKNCGFEEVMFIKNKEMDVRVLGLEKRRPEFVIISKTKEEVMLLEVNGMINVAKLPKLAETFNENAFLDVLHLKPDRN